MAEVWDSGPEDRNQLLVLLALADHADDHGRCWPSISRLARKARMSERTVQRAVRSMQSDGWLTICEQAGQRGANLYIIHNPTPVSVSPPSKRTRGGCQNERKGVSTVSPEPSRAIN